MSSASNYLEEEIGKHLLRTGSWTKPSAIYVGLFTTMPGEDRTGGTEVSGGSYTRVQCGPGDSYWTSPVGGSGIYTNTDLIEFPTPTANWGDIVGFGLFSAITSGDLYIIKAFAESVTVNLGDPRPGFSAGTLAITIA